MKKQLMSILAKTPLYPLVLRLRMRQLIADASRYDRRRLFRYVGHQRFRSGRGQLELRMMLRYHTIEKGLSFRDIRPGFGREPVKESIQLLREYHQKYGTSVVCLYTAQSLQAYLDVHQSVGYDLGDLRSQIESAIEPHLGPDAQVSDEGFGGAITLERERLLAESRGNFASLMKSRYSVRDFSEEPVSLELIEKAIEIAMKTPSVCNRQGWGLHIFADPKRVLEVLGCQNGNRGFTHQINKVAVVTSDLRIFVGDGERNQAYIDGGLFSMSFGLALHSLGVATCMLNCSLGPAGDRKLRQAAGIPDHEVIIMMIAMGHYPERLKVCAAARKPWRSIATLDGQPWPESSA